MVIDTSTTTLILVTALPVSDPVAWLDPVEAGAWRAWMAMSELVRAHLARDLQQECGMSEPDYAVLVHLSEGPDHRIRMSDLAQELHWSRSRLSHQVARMEARGQVRKEGCRSDARGWFAVLTASGLEDIRRAAPLHVASVRRNLIDALDPDQLAQLQSIAEDVLAHLGDRPADGPCGGDDEGPDTATP
jgi:DNA-binding MarR family transcriptional regulator